MEPQLSNPSVPIVSPATEEELPQKNAHLRTACADFVSKGWKFISSESVKVKVDYPLSSFHRIVDIQPEDIYLRIFNTEILDLMVVQIYIFFF